MDSANLAVEIRDLQTSIIDEPYRSAVLTQKVPTLQDIEAESRTLYFQLVLFTYKERKKIEELIKNEIRVRGSRVTNF